MDYAIRTTQYVPLLCCCALLWACAAPVQGAELEAGTAPRLIASPEPGWPQWRGPRRDAVCDERGLLPAWPAGGPKLLWKTNGLGRGYTAPIITGGRLFLAGDVEDTLRIFALDMTGNRLWQAAHGPAWKGPYPGARASCALAQGRLFQLSAHGRLGCWDAASGTELWAVDIRERFGGKVNTWAYGECVLVEGERVIVTPGGPNALMAALDVRTGATVWTTPPLRLGPSDDPAQQRLAEPAGEADPASYASPILFSLGGRRQLANCSMRHVFGVDAETGKLLWTRPLRTTYSVIVSTPVLVGDAVFVTAPDTEQATLHRLRNTASGVSVTDVWTTKLDTCNGGLVYVGDAIYGAWYRRHSRGYGCVDARTGEIRYLTQDLAKGTILSADGRLYCLSEEGEMALLKPTPAGFELAGRFRLVPAGSTDVWAHPVILDRKLYLRHHDTLFCYDVRAE